MEDCYPPAEIVEKMVLARKQTDGEANIARMNGNERIGADEVEDDMEGEVDENEKDKQDTADQEGSKGTMPMILPGSQVARAQMIVDNKKCIYQPEMKVFTVQGTCDVHAVKLFPKQSYTCPAKSECYHILSAKLYMGMDLGKKQKKITMTQLRRNTRPRTNRKKGRKGPLTEDEVEPAPDARVNQTRIDSNVEKNKDDNSKYIIHTSPIYVYTKMNLH